jgi:hypothetical protein
MEGPYKGFEYAGSESSNRRSAFSLVFNCYNSVVYRKSKKEWLAHRAQADAEYKLYMHKKEESQKVILIIPFLPYFLFLLGRLDFDDFEFIY